MKPLRVYVDAILLFGVLLLLFLLHSLIGPLWLILTMLSVPFVCRDIEEGGGPLGWDTHSQPEKALFIILVSHFWILRPLTWRLVKVYHKYLKPLREQRERNRLINTYGVALP